uniref:ADP-ribosyltransferase-containing protein n=1 Tax=Alistipes sp. TaxID=1872444 RepID=UPI0040571F8D
MSWDRYKSILDEVSARLKSSTTPSGRIDQSMAGRVASDMASIEEHRAPEEVQDTIDSELSGMSLRDRLGVISEKMGMASTVDSPFISEVAERVAPRVGSRRGVLPDPRGFNLVSDVVDPIRNREREQFDEARFSEVASALDRSFEGNDDDITRDYLSKLLSEQRSPIDGRISYSLNGVPISNSRDYADHILDRYYEYRNHDRLIDEDPEYRNRYIREISGGMSPEQYRGYLVDRYRKQLGEIESSYEGPRHEDLLDIVDYEPRSGLPVDEQRLVDDLREKLWTLEHNDSWWRSLGGGVTEGFNWADLLSLGVAGIGTDINQIGSLKRFRDALNSNPDRSPQEVLQTLSPRDQRMVRLYQIENDVEESFNLYGGRSSASTAGSALGAMPEFLAQMGITGGLGNAAVAALGRRFSGEAAEQITYKVVRDAFKESFKSGFKKVGEKILRTTGSAAVSAAVQTPISPMTLQNYADRTMAQYRWNGRMMEFSPESAWSRGWKSAIDTFAEYFSENVEGVISIGVEASGRGLSRLLHTDRLMYGADRQLRGFWHRHPSLRFLHDRFKISGPITETLSESIGDLVHPLLSGETERWDEMASSEYWWNLALSSTLMSATMNTPSLIALGIEANETRRMGNAREQAIGRIKSAELREMLWNALASDDISRSAETLSSFDWRNVSAEDKGNALDFIQSSLALEVMHSEENESRRLKLFDPIIKDAAQSVYRGSDASIPDFGGQLKLVYAQPQEGDIEQVVSGDYSSKDGVYYVRGKGGTPEARAVGSGLKVVEVPLDDFIAEQYALMFGSRIQQERMRDVMQFVQAAARSGAPATQLLLEKGYSVYRVGNKITLTDGVEGVVEDVHGGGNYIVRRSDGQVVSVGFLDVLQPNPEVANAQIDMANNPEQSPMDGITEPQTSGADGTVRVGNTIRFGEKIGVVTEIQSDGSLVVNVNDEYESIPVSSVTENLGDSPLIPQLDPVPPADSSQAAAEQTSSGSTQSADQAAIVSTPATKAQINIPVTKKGEIDYESIADPDILAQLYISKLGEEEAKEEVLALIAVATEDLQRTKKTLTQSRSANVRMQKRDKIKLIESRIAMLNVALERIAGQPAVESTQVSTADESQTQEKEDWRKEIPVPRAQRIEQLFPEINAGIKVYDWEIYALAMIASGQRFIWDGSKYGVRGLVEELFGRDREGKAVTAERQSRISMIASPDKGGISIDSAAESIYSQLDGYTHEYDIADIRDAVINALLGVYSPSQAMALLEEIAARENDAEERYYEDKIGGPVLYSDEVDEYGNHFILASDGTSNFGVIDAESGLKHAPIKLSMGDNTVDENGNNHGYGLLHIEAERGNEIRKAGYSSVQDFVESVAKNYTDIREGGVIANNQTYLLELVDDHNNTLFIQLSKNGEYWTINSAGIFRKKYSRNKRKVYDRPALSPDTNTNTSGVDSGNANGVTAPAGNSPQTSVNKDTTTGPNLQEESAKFAQNGPVQSEERETYDNVLSASEAQSEESVLLDDSQAATQADNNTASLGINSSELSKSKGTTTDPNLQEESVDLVQFNIQPAGITHRSRHLLSAGNTESGSGQSKIGVTPSLLDVVRTLYSKGKEVASKLFGMKYFDVAQTPKFMQGLGLRGDKFTIKYGVIARHLGKDSSHTLTERDWGQLPQALQNPFAISKLIDKEDSYRIYTTLRTEDGEFVVVGADVKNAGREIEVNAISTVFGRRNNANLSKNEEVIYRSKEITPEQSALLERPNFAQYPIGQELPNDKGTTIIPNSQISKDGKVSGKEAPIDAEIERVTIVDDLLDEYDARIDDAERKLESRRKELEEVKSRYGKEYNKAQTDLFGQSANDREAAKGGNLFNIEANLSQENMDSILAPIQAQIVALERRVQELKDEREAYHEHLLESGQAQTEIPFYINRTPSSAPEVISPERWNALTDQLKHILGEENVITDPEVMRFVYEASMGSASGMRHAMVESTNERFNQLLEELSEENADRTIFDLGNPSPAMLSVGIPNRPLRLNGNKLIKKAKQHKFTPQAIANLPQVIETPIAIFKGSYEGTYAILVELNINGSNVLATVDINKASELNVNLITSVYGKEKRLVAKWIDSGKALYIDKEKALNYLISPALIAGDPSNTGLDDTAKIVQNFKNSIIEPQDLRQSIIGYHGSKADFSAFDHAFMSTGEGSQAYGYGTYITEVAEIAEKYASAGIGTQISLLEESIALKRDGIIAGERYISELKSKQRQFDINDPIRQVYDNAIRYQEEKITEVKEAISKYEGLIEDLRQTPRNRYTVHIPDDTGANYLPYDLPIGSDIADRINSKLEMVAPDATLISYLQSGRQAQRIIAEGLGVDERSEAVSDFLASVGLVGVSYPANFTRGGRKDGAKNYVIFNPEDAKIVDTMRLFKTPQGEVYGFTVGGKIYLDPTRMTVEAPIHEYVELWSTIVARENPGLWERGKRLITASKMWQQVNEDPNYRNASEDVRVSEALSRIVAAEAAGEAKKISSAKHIVSGIRSWLKKFWGYLKQTFSSWSSGDLDALTLEEFTKLPLRDFVEGINISDYLHTDGSLLDGSAVSDAQSLREALNKEILPETTLKEAYAHNLQRVARKFGYENIDALVDDYTNLPSAFEQYRRTAGEVEARNVQKRHKMTSGDRRQTLAIETEDVARKDQIFLRSGIEGRYQSLDAEVFVKNQIEQLFNQAISGEFKDKPISIGRLTDAGKAYLEQISGVPFKDKVDFVLNPSDLVHIYKDHFGNNEKDKDQNIPLDIEDIRNLADVISSPDKVIFFKEGEGNNRNMFYSFKGAEDGTYNLMEIYSDRKGNLTAKTFYKTRKGSNQRVIDIEKSLLRTSEPSLVHPLSDAKVPQMFEFSNIANDFNSKLTENDGSFLDEESDIRYRSTKHNDYNVTPEAYAEMVEIREAAKRNGTFMMAPNGEPTNLNERQWLQVRTRSFKAWFGDWEKVARVKKLRKSSPVEIAEDAHAGKYELDRKSAENYLLENLRGEYTIKDTGDLVTIARRGAQKVLSHSADSEAHLRSIIAIPQLLERAIFIEEEKPDKPNAKFDSYRYYVCGINIGKTPYTARITIGVKQGKYYYDHSLTEIEKGNLIEIANGFIPNGGRTLPPYAENKDTRIIPLLQTNASKIVDANGEPLVVYHGTPNEFTIFDKPKQGTSTDRGIWGNGFYFTSDRTYAGIYESRHGKNGQTLSLFLNIKNPLIVDTADINNEGKKLFTALNNKYFTDDVFEDAANVDENMRIANRQMTDELIGSGYDGVVITYGRATDEYVAFEPNQIKSATENDGRFSDEENDIRYRRGSGDIFYSNAEEAVWAIRQEKATPEQWLNMLQKSGGLKVGEDKWIGLSDWLRNSEKKTLSKQEVLEYIAQNKIQIEETTYSSERVIETTPEFKALYDRYHTLVRAAEEESRQRFDDFVRQMEVKYGFPENEFDTTALSETEYNIFSYHQREISNAYIDAWATLHDEYGDNFDKAFWTDIGGLHLNNSEAAMALLGLQGDNPINSTREGITTKGLDGLREIALTVPAIEPWGRYDEIHFGDAGDGRAIAWIRFGETVDEDGNRVLVIDEIQSKRHQDGRSRGYKTKEQIEAMNQAVEAVAHATRELNEYRDSLREKYNYEELTQSLSLKESTRAFMDAMTEEERTRYTELHINHTKATTRLNQLREEIGRDIDRMVPEAPFEKNWAELSMKRMLRYAAENGFDKVAWTTGEQQAERYDLSKQIDAIGYRTLTGKNGEQRYNISAYRDGNTILNNIYDSEAEIERYYGKDIARKIVNGEGEKSGSETTLSGLDLKVGGQGMQGFYDKMLVEFMNKYGKRWGVKVGEVTMPRLMENNTMHAVEVTDAMRDSVMEGQLMFRLPFIETGLTPRYYLEETYRALLQNANKDPNFAERINGILERIREYDAHDFVAETYKVDPLSDDHLTAVSDVVYDLQREYGISSQIRVVRDLKEFREAILREVLDGESYKPSKEELAELKKYIEERYTEIAEGIYSHLSDVIILRADVARDKRYAGQKLFHEWTHAIEKRMRKEDKEFADLFEHFRGTQDLSYTRKLLEPRYKITDDLEGRERGATELLARGVEKLYQWAKTDAYFGLEDAALDPVVSYMEQREVPADLVKLITTCLKQIKKSKYDTSRDDGSAPSMGGYGPRYYLERARRDRVPGKEVGISRDVLETVSPGGGVSETRRLGNERGGGLQASAGYSRDLTTLSYPSFIQTLKNLSARFGVPIEVVEDTSRLRGAKRTAKGWFDIATGKVVIVLPNSSSIEDVEATYLHEVVAHYGLRRLMGTKFRPFLQSVWDSLPTEKQQELLKIHRTDRSDIAVEEFIAELAEGNVTVGLMARIVAAVRKFFRDIMGLPLRMSEKDILYMLYLSKRNLESASSNLAKVQILSDQRRMKDQLDVRFRQKRLIYDGATGQFVETDTKDGWSISKDAVKAVWKGARKLLQDRMIHYKDFQDMLEGRGVKVDNLTDFYNAENRFTSRAEAARSRFEKDFIDPLSNVISLLSDQTGLGFDNISDYIAAETAEERDRSGVQAVSREEKDPWNYWYVNGLIRSTRERITNSRNDIFAKEGYSALSEDEKKIISKEILKKFENDGWDALADHERFVINEAAINLLWMRIRAITDQTLEYFVQGGLKTREGIEKIKGHGWKYYTPLINFDTEVENMEDPLQVYDFIQKQTTRRAGVALHKAEGRKTKPANPVISMLNIAERVIVASEMNKTKQYLLRLLRSAEKKMGAEQADSLWRMAKVYFVKAKDESGKVHLLKTTETPSAEELEKARKLKESIIETKINLREIHQDLKKLEKDLEKANGPRRRRIAERIADLEKEKEKLLNSMLTQEAEETITTTPGNFDFSDETPLADQIDRQRIVEIYENGTLIQIKFKDPAIANAINGQMSSQFAEYADKLLNKTFLGDITRWRAASVTTLSPDFLLRNGVRDFIHASLIHLIDAENGQFRHFMKDYKSKLAATKRGASGTGKPLTAAECGAFSVLTKEGRVALAEKYGKARVYDTLFEIFVIEGGQTGFVHVRETETLEKDMRRSVTSKRTSGSKVARSAKSTSRKIVEGYKHLNESIEDATRFATFVANIEAGKSVFDAVTQAKNITVNFNRKGELTGALGTIYMFFNPTVQGTAQLANVAAKNPLRASVVALTLVSLGFLNYGLKKLLEYDEDDDNLYAENIPDYLYDNHAVLPLFGRNSILQILPKHLEEKMTLPFKSTWFVKIPLPNGSRFLYNWGAILARAAYGEYESWTKFTGDMVDAFLSETLYGYSAERELGRALIPSFAQPFYDVAVNKDAFGRPIHRDDKFDTNIPDSELGMSNVTPVCYFTCKALHTLFGGTPQRSSGMRSDGTINSFLSAFDINPSNLEYIISEFAGGPGRTGLQIWRTALSLFDEDEDFDLRNIPVINTVVGQSRQTRPNSEYYDTRKGIEAMRTIYDRELSSGNISRDNPEYVLFTRRKAVFDQLKKRVNNILKKRNTFNIDTPEWKMYNEQMDYMMRVTNKVMGSVVFSDEDWINQTNSQFDRYFSAEIMNGIAKGNETK